MVNQFMNRPYVILNAAMTLDGKIATKSGDSKISDQVDLEYVHKLRNKVDAIIVGINTVLCDDPMLNVRYVDKIKDPKRIIVDSYAKIPLNSQIVKTAKKIKTYLACTNHANIEDIDKLISSGVNILFCGEDKLVNLEELMKKLYDEGIKKILLEGGSTLNWSMFSHKLVDEVRITIGAKIIGGKNAKTLVDGIGFDRVDDGIKLTLLTIKQNQNYVRLKYKVR